MLVGKEPSIENKPSLARDRIIKTRQDLLKIIEENNIHNLDFNGLKKLLEKLKAK